MFTHCLVGLMSLKLKLKKLNQMKEKENYGGCCLAILCVRTGPATSKTLWSALHMADGHPNFCDSARVALVLHKRYKRCSYVNIQVGTKHSRTAHEMF